MSKKTARANLLDKPNGKFVVGQYPLPEPKSGEVLMKIEMCGICGTDIHTWHAPAEAVFGLEYPISLGHEISGIIESLGDGVTTDSVGTPVKVGDTVMAKAEITELIPEKKRALFKTQCLVGDTVVIDGEAQIMVPTRD